MKNKDILSLYRGLESCGNITGQKFGYVIARNISLLKPLVDSFNDAKDAMLNNYAKKDENGKKVKDQRDEFIIVNQEEADAEFKKLMEEDVAFTPFNLNKSDIPDTINSKQLTGIFPIIKDDGK